MLQKCCYLPTRVCRNSVVLRPKNVEIWTFGLPWGLGRPKQGFRECDVAPVHEQFRNSYSVYILSTKWACRNLDCFCRPVRTIHQKVGLCNSSYGLVQKRLSCLITILWLFWGVRKVGNQCIIDLFEALFLHHHFHLVSWALSIEWVMLLNPIYVSFTHIRITVWEKSCSAIP